MQQIKLTSLVLLMMATAAPALAGGDLSRANVQEVVMEMGTDDDGHMYFKPDTLTFETGKAYKWVLKNTDEIKHELAINEMRERIFTRKIEIAAADGTFVAEIKGDINEVEIGAGQTVEWFFVPVQNDEEIEISCEIEGHYEAGMHGIVSLK